VVKSQGSTRTRRIRSAAFALLLAAAAHLGESPAAGAHAEFVPTLVNRYISLTAFESRVDVLVSLLYGDLPGGERRRLMDLDRSGRVEAREVQRERQHWARSADRVVRFAVDGRPVGLTPVGVLDLNGDPLVRAKPLLVTLHGSFDLAPGDRQVRVEGPAELPRLGETEISLDVATGWALVASLDAGGKATGTAQRLFQFPAARGDDGTLPTVTFVLRSAGPGDPVRRAWGPAAWLLLGGTAAALLGLVLVALRARRRPR
jgi:hypothetical protein